MRRTTTFLGLITLTLLMASGTGAAQSLSGDAYAEGHAEMNGPEIESTQTNAGSPNDLSAEAYAETETHAEASTEEVAPEIDEAELKAMLDELAKESQPEPEPEPASEEPEPEPEPEVPPEEIEHGFDVNTDGEGSIDANASSTTRTHVEHSADEPVVDVPEPASEEPEPEPTPEPQLETEDALDASLDGDSDVETYLDTRQGKVIEAPAEPSEDEPVSYEIDDQGDGGFGIHLRAAFQATTDGFTGAFDQVRTQVEDLVSEVKGLFAGRASTSTHVENAVDTEIIDGIEGSLGLDTDVTTGVTSVVETVQLPELEVPPLDLATTSEVSSRTSVESTIIGDLGIGL